MEASKPHRGKHAISNYASRLIGHSRGFSYSDIRAHQEPEMCMSGLNKF